MELDHGAMLSPFDQPHFAAIQTWAPQFRGKLLHLYCDNTPAVDTFQAGHSKDSWIQACAQQIWPSCTTYDITLAVDHISGEHLTSLADTISSWYMGQYYKDYVNDLVQDRGITLFEIPCDAFQLSTSL